MTRFISLVLAALGCTIVAAEDFWPAAAQTISHRRYV
jgi:hypothetical protein